MTTFIKPKYFDDALRTVEKIKGNQTSYYANRIYHNEEFNIYWYENTKGYMHVLKPQKNPFTKGIETIDFLITKDNMLKETGTYGNFETVEDWIEEMQREMEE